MPAGKTLAANERPLASDINTICQSGTLAARPATEDVTAGSLYYVTDSEPKVLYQEQNGSWVALPFG